MVDDIDDDFEDIDDMDTEELTETEDNVLLSDNQKDPEMAKAESQTPLNSRRRLEQLREEKALERLLRGDYYD
ncbi:MAG: hypothetical protein RQ936_03190 [Gammaproteobacteria bacterium]|nr:hypothetical protein [Gammaproteobacteria bacterium]